METIKETGIPVEKGDELFEDAYEHVRPEMLALKKEELLSINLDIPSAVFTAIGVVLELNALEHEIRKLPDTDAERVLALGTYARALGRAHALYLAAVDPTDALQPLVEEGTALREVLLADANALVRRKLMNGERLKELAGPIGYKNLAFDLEILGAVFDQHYPKIEGKWGTGRGEIRRAREIAAAIAKVVGEREQIAARVAETADMRARAFTVFLRAYDEARRAVTYLRWHKADVNDITPSLYVKRGRRKDPEGTEVGAVTAPIAGDSGALVTDHRITAAPAVAGKAEVGTANGQPFLA